MMIQPEMTRDWRADNIDAATTLPPQRVGRRVPRRHGVVAAPPASREDSLPRPAVDQAGHTSLTFCETLAWVAAPSYPPS
jgi:hypothetical protein